MSVSVVIKNGNLDLLTSGIFLVNANNTTTLTLTVNNEHITLIIKFVNSEDKLVKKVSKVISNTTLEITFTNYNSYVGNYTKDFWKIASINNRQLYWAYTIYGFLEGNVKKIDYSFYLGEVVGNG